MRSKQMFEPQVARAPCPAPLRPIMMGRYASSPISCRSTPTPAIAQAVDETSCNPSFQCVAYPGSPSSGGGSAGKNRKQRTPKRNRKSQSSSRISGVGVPD